MTDWEIFLLHIRKAYRTGYSPPADDYYNHAKDPEESHIEWEKAVRLMARMVLNGDLAARKAARLTTFVQDHEQIGWWYA